MGLWFKYVGHKQIKLNKEIKVMKNNTKSLIPLVHLTELRRLFGDYVSSARTLLEKQAGEYSQRAFAVDLDYFDEEEIACGDFYNYIDKLIKEEKED